jgi:hypothetical protein
MAGVTEPTINPIIGQYDGRELDIMPEESAIDLDEGQGQVDSLIPVEIRKPMAAYYTLPEAARLLAGLAILDKDDSIIDPACGSGTLLVAAYQEKKRMYGAGDNESMHEQFLAKDILGIEFMPFAARLAAKHLVRQNPQNLSTKARIGITDAMAVKSDSRIPSLENEQIVVGKAKVMLMNPPFSRFQNLSRFSDAGSYVNSMKHHFGNRIKHITNNMSFNNFFLLKCEDFLEQNGRVASVLPATTLVGGSNEKVRDYLSKRYNIDAIIIRSDRCNFSEDTELQEILLLLTMKSDEKVAKETDLYILRDLNKERLSEQITTASSAEDLSSNDAFAHSRININESGGKNWFQHVSMWGFEIFSIMDTILEDIEMEVLEDFCESIVTKNSSEPKHKKMKDGMSMGQSLPMSRMHILGSWSTTRDQKPSLTKNFVKSDSQNVYFTMAGISGQSEIKKSKLRPYFRSKPAVNRIRIDDFGEHILYENPTPDGKHSMFIFQDVDEDIINWEKWKKYCDNRTAHLALIDRLDFTSPNETLLSFFSSDERIWARICTVVKTDEVWKSKFASLWLNSTFGLFEWIKNRQPQRAYCGINGPQLLSMQLPKVESEPKNLDAVFSKFSDIEWPSLIQQYYSLCDDEKIKERIITHPALADSVIAKKVTKSSLNKKKILDEELMELVGGKPAKERFKANSQEFYNQMANNFVMFLNFMQ